MAAARCQDCGVEYQTTATDDEGLCPTCQRVDDQMFATDRGPVVIETEPWKWSKAAMRERLGE